MSTEPEPSGSIWDGRTIVEAGECDDWRRRVHNGESAAQVARDADEWAYATIHDHIRGESCEMHGSNAVDPATTRGSGGVPEPATDEIDAVREGVRAALEANYGDTANIRIKTFRKRRAVDLRGQRIGAVLRKLAAHGDPEGVVTIERPNPESNSGWWIARFIDGGSA